MEKTTHIFISHSHKYRDFVNALAKSLQEKDIPLWIDTSELELGSDIKHFIEEAIRSSSAFILCIDAESNKNHWLEFEWSVALEEKWESNKKIIPILFGDSIIPPFLANISVIRVYKWEKEIPAITSKILKILSEEKDQIDIESKEDYRNALLQRFSSYEHSVTRLRDLDKRDYVNRDQIVSKIYTETDLTQKALSFMNLANWYRHLKEFNKAEPYAFEAIKIYEELGNKKNICFAYSSVSHLYKDKGDYKKALLFCNFSIDLQKRIRLKNKHLVLASIFLNKAEILINLNENKEALKILEEVKEIFANYVGENHPIESDINLALGKLFAAEGDDVKARKAFARGLKINQNIYGKDSPKYSEIRGLIDSNL